MVVDHSFDEFGAPRCDRTRAELDRGLHGVEIKRRRKHVALDLGYVLCNAQPKGTVGQPIEVIALDLDDKAVVAPADATSDVGESTTTRRILLKAWSIGKLDIHRVEMPRLLLLAIVFAPSLQLWRLGSPFLHAE